MNNEGQSQDRLLNEVEAARFLGLRPRTLQNWRWSGEGPPFVRVSNRAIRYRISDLRRWVEERVVTTTDPQQAGPPCAEPLEGRV